MRLAIAFALLLCAVASTNQTAAKLADPTEVCSVCNHVYDPAKDGAGKAFADLPDTWKCPVCQAPKSAYKPQTLADGSKVWVHAHAGNAKVADPTEVCSVCNHVYDPAKDGAGKAFADLPDTWKCPVCQAPKSAYKPQTLADGSKVWVHAHAGNAKVADPTEVCSVCNHVYDPAKDGAGKAFADLPDTWKCPVCQAPKSAYKPQTLADGSKVWVH